MTVAAPRHVRLWAFRVPPDRRADFERRYGPGGDWAALFAQGAGWLGTELLADAAEPGRYVTVDRWESAAAWDAFRARFAAEYEALDSECESLGASEEMIGAFEER
ncbi:MAG TPA: antibiotic biosynthesis monooxygenase [Anaeromyxobacteraceae bacterium]|nr:antibiotic biosynthesis monooxygenase [Anaeromyxobacteraceae bacterium]